MVLPYYFSVIEHLNILGGEPATGSIDNSVRILPPLMIRAFGAHCQLQTFGPWLDGIISACATSDKMLVSIPTSWVFAEQASGNLS